jgi:DNA-binding SARP family transcriptional activator
VSAYDSPTNPVLAVEIEVEAGPAQGQRQVLRHFPALLGRGTDADMRLEDDPSDPTISRRHLRVELIGGKVRIADVSSNGTWLGGQQLEPDTPIAITADDAVWLGPRTMIRIRVLGDARPAPARTAAPTVPSPAPSPARVLELDAFGPGQVAIGGRTVPDSAWQSRKALPLLACLADHAPRPVPPDRLEAWLWPDAAEGARQALQTVVSRIRRATRAIDAAPDLVRLERAGYAIAPEYALVYDVRRFESALALADMRALREALDLYHGDFLEGLVEDWVEARRRALLTRACEAHELLAAHHLGEGRPTEAFEHYARVLEREPCRETSLAGRVHALHAAGRRDEAVQAYHEAVRVLKKTLGLPPSAELVEAYEQFLRP